MHKMVMALMIGIAMFPLVGSSDPAMLDGLGEVIKEMSPKPTRVKIADIPKTWNFDIVSTEKEMGVTINQIGDNSFEVFVVPTKDMKAGYVWDVALCGNEKIVEVNKTDNKISTPLSKQETKNTQLPPSWCQETGEAYTLFSSEHYLTATKNFSFSINTESERFKLMLGAGSVVIDASANTAATIYTSQNIVMESDGKLHVAYEGGSSDLWYASSTDDGASWDAKELQSGTVYDVGIVIDSNDKLYIHTRDGGQSNDASGWNSSNSGVDWGTKYLLSNPSTGYAVQTSCAADSKDIIHCCIIDGNGRGHYFNYSNLDVEVAFNEDTSHDSDYCDIEVDSNDIIYIVAVGSDDDALDLWTSANGWGQANKVVIDSTIGVGWQHAPSIAIDDNDNIFVTAVEADADLQFYNSTAALALTTWTQTEIDASTSYTPDIATNSQGIYILYQDQPDNTAQSDSEIYLANSTDLGKTWVVRKQLQASSGLASILDSNNPYQGRMTNKLRYVYSTSASDIYYDSLDVDYDYNLGFDISVPSTASPVSVVSGQNFSITFNVSTWGNTIILGVAVDNISVGNKEAFIANRTVPGDIIYIRSGTDGDTGVGNPDTITFTDIVTDAYSALISVNYSAPNSFYSGEFLTKTSTSFEVKIESNADANLGRGFQWAGISHGEYDVDGTNYVKCGNATIIATAYTVTFSTAFPDVKYSAICSVMDDTDATACQIDGPADPKTATGFGVANVGDGGAGDVFDSINWCAFSHGEYTIGNVSFKAGNSTQTSNILVGEFTTIFPDVNYVLFISPVEEGSDDPCACAILSKAINNFTAECNDDDGSTNNCDNEIYDWVAFTSGDFNATIYVEHQDFGYTAGKGWEANITAPNHELGLQNLTINATYDEIAIGATQLNSINYTNLIFVDDWTTWDEGTYTQTHNDGKNVILNYTLCDAQEEIIYLVSDDWDTIEYEGDTYDIYDGVYVGDFQGGKEKGYWAFPITSTIYGATIHSVTFTGTLELNDGDFTTNIIGLQQEDCPELEGGAPEGYDETTESVAWNPSAGTGVKTTPDFKTVFNEWVGDYTHSGTDYFGFKMDDGDATTNEELTFTDAQAGGYDDDSYLTISYSPPGCDYLLGNYTSRVFNATTTVDWQNITWSQTLPDGTNIDLLVHDCDDSACSGEENDWDDVCTTSPCTISVADSQYFQYKANFSRTESSTSAALINVITYYALIIDECDVPISGDWVYDCANTDCDKITLPLSVPANWLLKGAGSVIINSTITFTGSNQYVELRDGCQLEIRSGGQIS